MLRARRHAKQIAITIVAISFVLYIISRVTSYIIEREEMKIRNMNRIHEISYIDMRSWKRSFSVCDGNFRAFGNQYAILKYVYVDPQTKSFSVPCDKGFISHLPSYTFQSGGEGTPLQLWYNTMKTYLPSKYIATKFNSIKTVTFVVERVEAHNLYHTMCEWYNIFLLSKLLDIDSRTSDVLLLDDRPASHMDEIWNKLYRHVWRRKDFTERPLYTTLIWNAIGYESPLNFHELVNLEYVDEFYRYFIKAYDIAQAKKRDCSNLMATVIWRRDYMTHPERQKMTGGKLHRKFKNEEEILNTVKTVMKGHVVRDVTLEELNMKQQLDLITQTDILVGMHGAALTHVLFLPDHAGVFEMFPKHFTAFNHFKAFARWRGLSFIRWQNDDEHNEFPDFYTYIPPDIVQSHMQQLKNQICPE